MCCSVKAYLKQENIDETWLCKVMLRGGPFISSKLISWNCCIHKLVILDLELYFIIYVLFILIYFKKARKKA